MRRVWVKSVMSQYLQTPAPAPQQYPQQPLPQPKRHGLALWVLICGVVGVVFFPLGIAAILMGFSALSGIKKSQGWLTGKGMVYTGMLGGVLGLLLLAMVIKDESSVTDDGLPSGQAITPGATLKLAESNILSGRDGVAYSNSEDGLQLAQQFSDAFKAIAIESTDALSDHDEFVTHCQLHDSSAAFVVHVPKLRKFNSESKAQFCDGAWMLANSLLSASGAPDGIDLAVAVKGIVIYENMYFGKFDGDVENQPTNRGKNSEALEEFFQAAPANQEENSP